MQSPIPNPAYQPPTQDHSGRAIEVTGMLGDSVVCVKHLSPEPPQPNNKKLSRILLASAALLLAVSAFAFAKGVSVAADNKAAYTYHTAVLEKPVHEFRPTRLSPIYDVMAFGGLLGGLLSIGFAYARHRSRPASSRFAIGREAGVDFETADVAEDRFELVKDSPQGPVVHVANGMDLVLRNADTERNLSELIDSGDAIMSLETAGGYEILLPTEGDVRIDSGLARFLVKSVPAPRKSAAAAATMEARTAKFFLGSAIVHAVVLALIWNFPSEAKMANIENLGDTDRYISTRLPGMELALQQPEKQDDGNGDAARGEEPGEINGKGMMGTNGTPDSTAESRLLEVDKRSERDHMAHTRADAVRMARRAGVLGYFASEREIFTSLSSTYDFASGYDDEDIAGGYTGTEYGDVWGPGSPSWGNTHHNFSNSPYYRDGIYRTINGYDAGTPDGNPLSKVPGPVGPRKPKFRGTRPKPGKVVISDGLDKATVRRYIRKKLNRMAYCYDKELLSNPQLAGTVKTRFTISPQGKVQGADSSGMGSALNSCVTSAISSIQFPKTHDGTSTRVTYPFHFRNAGSQ